MQRMIKTLSALGVFLFTTLLNGQVQSEAYMQYQQQVDEIFTESLTKGHAYARLGELCKDIGARLSGSDQAEKGIEWAVNMLNTYGFDSVYKQPVYVPRWTRGNEEYLGIQSKWLIKNIGDVTVQKRINEQRFSTSPAPLYECEGYLNSLEERYSKEEMRAMQEFPMSITALGGSIGGEIKAKVIVANNKRSLDSLGERGELEGKVVLLNRPFEENFIETFRAYGSCVTQRVYGAIWSAPYGAKAVLVRSMSNRCDMHPHTGVTYYKDSIKKIPIAAVSTAAADALSFLSQKDVDLQVHLKLTCETLPDRLSANVIAEIRGSESPRDIIAIGGHFDSWDAGEGAHDDGAGIMHCFETLRLFRELGIKPKHTLRLVFWINEENGTKGAWKYANHADSIGEKHLFALESDRGGFTPRGFGLDSLLLEKVKPFSSIFYPYGIHEFRLGGGGVDIGPIKKLNPQVPLASFIPDSQRYFDVHHSETDVFESVNKRELQLGAAAIASLIYILDAEID